MGEFQRGCIEKRLFIFVAKKIYSLISQLHDMLQLWYFHFEIDILPLSILEPTYSELTNIDKLSFFIGKGWKQCLHNSNKVQKYVQF